MEIKVICKSELEASSFYLFVALDLIKGALAKILPLGPIISVDDPDSETEHSKAFDEAAIK